MNKVLIEITIPAAGKVCDFWIPRHLHLSEALKLISKIANETCDGLFIADDSTLICNKEDGKILNLNHSIYELGLKNGSKLILI